MKKVILFIAIILGPALAWAQKLASTESKSSTTLSFNVDLEPHSEAEDVTFDIQPGVESFELLILSSVKSGKVKIEILDPKDNKEGTLSVGTTSSQKRGNATGTFTKSSKEPLSGTWKVKIKPASAKGFVQIQIRSVSSL